MITIYKYPLKLTEEQEVEMYDYAEVLSAHKQYQNICIWAKVNTDNWKSKRKFYIRGTGHELNLPSNVQFIGTVIMDTLVFHVWVSFK